MFSVSDDCHAHGSAHDIKYKNTYEFPEEKILAEEKRNMRIAFVGVGNISEIYLENITNMFREIEVIGVCDLIRERAEKAVEKYNIPKLYNDMYELFADDDVDIVLNITEAYNHYAVTKAALEAGKNVYSEKPLATTLEQGKELVRLAKEKGVRLGGAPDTFLGGGIQTCRRLIEDGYIGDVFGGSIHMICRGPEGWHPDPEAFYQPGAGPMFDMGPYYMTALANLLGRCSKITGFSGRAHKERIIGSGPRYGQKIPVNVDTFVCGTMLFDSGAIVDSRISFDVYCFTSDYAHIELYGTEGVLYVPDPNAFNGQIKIVRGNEGVMRELPTMYPYKDNCRGVGLADMAKAIQIGREHRCSNMQQLHVLEMMESFTTASREERVVTLETPYERGPIMDIHGMQGILD